ncbi:hypothetical protein GC207_09595 [bacterium]|nr:hypothetical protein [bacterium]
MSTLLLGQVVGIDPPQVSPAVWDMFYVGGVALAVAVIIFIVVAVTRGRTKSHHKSRRGPEILRNSDEHLREKAAAETEDDESESPQRRRRRRRRDHRPRNPTLAEAGGLPPERDPNSAPNTGL